MKNKLSVFSIDSDVAEQMLSAGELIYYLEKFRGKIFVIFFQEKKDFLELEEDLELLRTSGLNCLVFAPDISKELAREYNYSYYTLSSVSLSNLSENFTLISYNPNKISLLNAFNLMFKSASYLKATKIFILSQWPGINVKNKYFSNLSYLEFFKLNISNSNIPKSFFRIIKNYKNNYKGDIVVLENKQGSIFQETFSHRGSGTLVTDKLIEGVKKACLKDVKDILFLLYPNFKNTSILNISKNEILKNINNFYVYHCNEKIVSATYLKDYGDAYELSKICSLPRYQGKGRAFSLIEHVLEKAFRSDEKSYVFALSNVVSMQDFFKRFKFKETSKTELPKEWYLQYDKSRSSKAFILTKETYFNEQNT